MILYNWATIYRKTDGHPSAILGILGYLTFPSTPKNVYDPAYKLSQVDWSGDSFLVNPEKVIQNRNKFSDLELAEYIALASFRSYSHYKLTGDKTLDKLHCPLDNLPNNRLLSCVNGKIYFCWEETTQ